MTSYAPDNVIQCPKCSALSRVTQLASYNTLWEPCWSDGYTSIALEMERMAKCPSCNVLFWIGEAKIVGHYDWENIGVYEYLEEVKQNIKKKYGELPPIKDNRWAETAEDLASVGYCVEDIFNLNEWHDAQYENVKLVESLTALDFADAIDLKLYEGNVENERYLRLMLWWKVNDFIRDDFNENNEANLSRLFEVAEAFMSDEDREKYNSNSVIETKSQDSDACLKALNFSETLSLDQLKRHIDELDIDEDKEMLTQIYLVKFSRFHSYELFNVLSDNPSDVLIKSEILRLNGFFEQTKNILEGYLDNKDFSTCNVDSYDMDIEYFQFYSDQIIELCNHKDTRVVKLRTK